MEISLHILDQRHADFQKIVADLEDIVYCDDRGERLNFDRRTDIHDYLEDRFSHYPEMNRGHYPRNLGTLQNVIDTIEKDLAHVDQGGALNDQFELIYLDRNLNYTTLMAEVKKLCDELKAQTDIEQKHVALIWW